MKQAKEKLEIKQRRSFLEEFLKAKVKDIAEKQISIRELSRLYEVSREAIPKWLYKYSPHHKQKTILGTGIK